MENWIASVVGKMHVYKITQGELAEKLGVTREYVNKILGGTEKPNGAKERITVALNELIEEKNKKE